MSSTRLAQEGSPISYKRYMSSPEFAEMRGIPGTVVAATSQLYLDAHKRSLLFFLQSVSLKEGGLHRIAQNLAHTLSDDANELRRVLMELCINPKLVVQLSDQENQEQTVNPSEPNRALNWRQKRKKIYPQSYVTSVVKAALGFQKRYEANIKSRFVFTTIGRSIFETLDHALSIGKMVVIEGESGIGKTTAAEAWCASHQGQSRFVSLSGITHRTGFFHKLATAIGLAASNRKSIEMQLRVEEFFRKTRLMLVIDEAHYLFPQYLDRISRPELVNWVNTALVNHQVPVALICTDQFAKLKLRAEKRTGWTSEQFEHRVKRYTKLPAIPSKADLKAVAKSLLRRQWNPSTGKWDLPGPSAPVDFVKMVAGYAMTCKLPLPAIADTIEEARSQARIQGRSHVNARDIHRGLFGYQIPSNAAMQEAFRVIQPNRAYSAFKPSMQQRCNTVAQALQPVCNSPEPSGKD